MRALLVAMLTVGLTQAAATQESAAPTIGQGGSKGVVIRGQAPVATDVLKVKLPRPIEGDLPNGLHLMVLEDHRAPMLSFQLQIQGAGGFYDPAESTGLANFTASLLREGSITKTAPQIARELDTMAASLFAGAGQSSQAATINGSCLAEHVDRLLTMTSEIVLHPAFAQEEIDRVKVQRKAQLMQQRTSPGFLASEMFAKVTYGTHPAGRVSATPAFINNVTRDDLVTFHRLHYVPDFAVLAIAGDITFAQARTKAEAAFGAWPKSGQKAPATSEPNDLARAGVFLVDRPNSVQTNFIVGTQAIARTSPDYDAVEVMNKVIGGGPTGRLFMNLREDKGFTYGAYSYVQAATYRGTWLASTQVRTDVTGPALKELVGEITRLRDQTVPAAELDTAKRALVANYALSLESADRLLDYAITSWIYHLPADYWDRRPAALLAVTPEQVQTAARTYLTPARLQIVAVGTGATIGSILESYGPLNTFDVDGKAASHVSDSGK